MSSGGPGRERSRKDFLNTDFEQRFRLSVGPRLAPGLAQLGRKLGPSWLDIGPKQAFSWPKSASVGPSRPQDGLRWPKLAQVGANLAPSCPQVGPSWPQVGPSWPQVGPCLASWARVGSKLGQVGPKLPFLVVLVGLLETSKIAFSPR